jgi:hypothetical protein
MRTEVGFLCAQLACDTVERGLARAVPAKSLRETATTHDGRCAAHASVCVENVGQGDAARAGRDRDELGCGRAPVQQRVRNLKEREHAERFHLRVPLSQRASAI